MPPHTTQTSPRHPQGIPREHNMPTDANRHCQTPKITDRCCLSMSGGVCWRLLPSVGMLCSLELSGGCLGGVRGCSDFWVVFSWKLEALGCILGVSGFSAPAVWSQNTNLAKPWKVWRFVTWPYWDIKISKPPYVTFLKMVGFNQFM